VLLGRITALGAPFTAAGSLLALIVALGIAALVLSLVAAVHAVLYKRDSRSAVSWAVFILLLPFVGPFLYGIFGINRVQRRAGRLRRRRPAIERAEPARICNEEELRGCLAGSGEHLLPLARVGERVSGRKLLEGNRVEPLVNGEEAYPAMLAAVDGARRTVGLLAYIFEKDDAVGEKFVAALKRAKERGCEVRVLIDDVGSDDAVEDALHADGIPVARFLPLKLPGLGRNRYANLRNHRKILVVDGSLGFTGGMNLRASHLVNGPGPHREQDLHFRIEGPVVEHLAETFAEDWAFTTSERLVGDPWFPRIEDQGRVAARGLRGDPAETSETLRSVIVAALGQATASVRIATPYFLPDAALVAALNVAAMRGVRVDILLPEVNDNRVVHWATQAMLWQVLRDGCRVWRTPPPFDHTKLMVVDEAWTLLGSANLDPRSLRLNFEFNVEVYDRDLAGRLAVHLDEKRFRAREVTLKDVDSRPFPIRLRDGLARLWTPYL
jgi:cardiolipin synthase